MTKHEYRGVRGRTRNPIARAVRLLRAKRVASVKQYNRKKFQREMTRGSRSGEPCKQGAPYDARA